MSSIHFSWFLFHSASKKKHKYVYWVKKVLYYCLTIKAPYIVISPELMRFFHVSSEKCISTMVSLLQ